eukprot:6465658-Amphidinium_carterae.1
MSSAVPKLQKDGPCTVCTTSALLSELLPLQKATILCQYIYEVGHENVFVGIEVDFMTFGRSREPVPFVKRARPCPKQSGKVSKIVNGTSMDLESHVFNQQAKGLLAIFKRLREVGLPDTRTGMTLLSYSPKELFFNEASLLCNRALALQRGLFSESRLLSNQSKLKAKPEKESASTWFAKYPRMVPGWSAKLAEEPERHSKHGAV